jgi:hypothetical protein
MKPESEMLPPSKRTPTTKRIVLRLLCLSRDVLPSIVFRAGLLVAQHLGGREGGRKGGRKG